MEFSTVKSHMTTTFLAIFIIGLFNIQIANAFTGSGDEKCKTHRKKHDKKKHHKKECGENGYSTEIISVEPDGECYWYKIKVISNNHNNYELSHYNIDLGCGTITKAYNSEGWKMELNNEDPTTGFAGLKVDDVHGFGKNHWFHKFYVKFKFCPDDSCQDESGCFNPEAAYKAGQCVFYEELESYCEDVSDPLSVDSEIANPLCFGGNDGAISLHINGGVKPYSIIWSTGQADSVVNQLTTGEYAFEVTDAEGNTYSDTLELTSPEKIEITANLTHPTCAGSVSGSIDLSVQGGTGVYSFVWNSNETTEDLTGLVAGTYLVTVTDENGCSETSSFDLINSTQIEVSEYIVQPSCEAQSPGSIELEVTGGTEPYTFLWTDGSEEQNRYDLSEGDYTVAIADQNGCEVTRRYKIQSTSPINISTIVTPTDCHNNPVGEIELVVTGGAEPYHFEWSTGDTTQNLDGLTAGKYSVIATDANGCTAEYNVNINLTEIILYASQTAIPACPGDESAAIDLTVFFGQEPYTYEWSNGATTEDLEGIPSGDYTVTVTDAAGCTATTSVQVKDQNPIVVSYDVSVNGCAEAPEYVVDLTVTGGDDNYTYNWPTGETTSSVTFTEPGTYSVDVTDGNGCTVTQDIVVEGEPGTPSCLISQLAESVVCGSTGNILNTSIDGAVTYDWKVTSSDGSWTIVSATNLNQIEYTAGTPGSTATFYLEVLLESGCTAICVLDISACVDDNPDDGDDPDDGGDDPDDGGDDPNDGGDDPDDGGDDPDDGDDDPDDGDDKDCNDCFYSSDVEIVKDGYYFEYTFTVNHNGSCSFDLSHLTFSLPECAWIVDYSNSMGWKMEKIHEDPTTGMSGIKIDDIPEFGKDDQLTSFEVYFKLKSSDWDCKKELKCFAPEIAYKAGQCVQYEQTASECVDFHEPDVVTYPNPTHDWVKVCFDKSSDDYDYRVELFNNKGERIKYYDRKAGWGENCEFNLSKYGGSLFFIHVTRRDGYKKSFKVCKN